MTNGSSSPDEFGADIKAEIRQMVEGNQGYQCAGVGPGVGLSRGRPAAAFLFAGNPGKRLEQAAARREAGKS
jgi:hypothetical protein